MPTSICSTAGRHLESCKRTQGQPEDKWLCSHSGRVLNACKGGAGGRGGGGRRTVKQLENLLEQCQMNNNNPYDDFPVNFHDRISVVIIGYQELAEWGNLKEEVFAYLSPTTRTILVTSEIVDALATEFNVAPHYITNAFPNGLPP